MERVSGFWIDVGIGVGAVCLALGFGLRATLPPAPPDAVLALVIAPPWGAGPASIAASAGGSPVGPVAAPFAVLAAFDTPLPRARLFAHGAWALRDGRALATLCGVTP